MSILDEIKDESVWNGFYKDKTDSGKLTKAEAVRLESFIKEKRFLLFNGVSLPEKKTISKMGSPKKRVVYSFPEDETWCLKLIAYLLYRYDDKLCDNCYSFRRNITSATAFSDIRKISDLSGKYVLKADIHDYFNSIPADRLIEIISKIVTDDDPLLDFLKGLLTTEECIYDGTVIKEKMGAMAGVPLASFFADFYLLDLDRIFSEMSVPYFRYSDDILIFADSEAELKRYFSMLSEYIANAGLSFNEKKLSFSKPHTGFEFLGFHYSEGKIDISDVTLQKMQDKIRRKARSLRRKMDRNSFSFEKAATIMIRSFDRKLYDMTGNDCFTWTRFYFPVITVSDGLRKIDECMVKYLRYLYSGRHYKGNYKITYDMLKRLGYTSLVNEYYTWKKDNYSLSKKNETQR